MLTTRLLPAERRRARAIADRQPLHLHLGCTDAYFRGWCNVELRPNRPTRALVGATVFFLHGHRSSYDVTTLCTMAKTVGFESVEASRSGRDGPFPARIGRHAKRETLYVDAVRSPA